RAGNPNDFLQNFTQANGSTDSSLRQLGGAFPLGNSGAQPTEIIGLATSTGTNNGFLTIPQQIPSLPNGINVGAGMADNFSGILGVLDGYKINMVIDALDQAQGTDLLSAPKLTVLSTKHASITVAQRLIYPTDFSQIQATVQPAGGGGGNSTGGGGVAITAGTPSNFFTQNVGVQMEVTPTVEDDDSIDLDLTPAVTEFEGFIEYGGTSVAIQSGITATVPSGFIQPIFDVRQVQTQVTIFDGATVVIGGLTRDEVKTISDKVPILGDIPLIGRIFQSKGESTQKRNLMIFVTANLISPGGGLAKQSLPGAPANSLFQNPIVVTPAGDERRQPTIGTEAQP
ncbi:MAG TPA: type II and III secretion system protein, partial [Rhizomicrobium sp.]